MDQDKTDPNWKARYAAVESKTDKVLLGLGALLTRTAESPWTSWIVGGVVLSLIGLLIVLA